MTVYVVTVYTPRPTHEKWMDYGPLLTHQRASVRRQPDHHHVVVTDKKTKEHKALYCKMSDSLMHAILEGQIAFLEKWNNKGHVVLVDIDCLIGADLHGAFAGPPFHIGLTNRAGEHTSPINNGAMYIREGAREQALDFYRRALSLCGTHWGGDQEAISQAAAPVPYTHGVHERQGVLINFLSMFTHNTVPEFPGVRHKHNPYVIHFKGEKRKEWMPLYRERFLL